MQSVMAFLLCASSTRLGLSMQLSSRRMLLSRSFVGRLQSSSTTTNNEETLEIESSLRSVHTRIDAAVKSRPASISAAGVRLVAVSKTKPASALVAAYSAGHRDFGENYVQELIEKSNHPDLAQLEGLNYHFIGKIQSNKANMLIKKVPQLEIVETIDSLKLALKINSAVKAAVDEGLRAPGALKVMIQVNSSGEPQKGGVESNGEAVALAQEIFLNCPHLNLVGVMTIGNADYTAGPSNFKFLDDCRKSVAEAISVEESSLELSMGMSGDFESAILHGSTNVRVGSTIFGSRVYDK
mmetsp:Transcript_57669/g.99302  ORF Transcript_57669/g.99302 Transcript_57669/m.99302 type:complete len:297 (+) Transcript_57669:52-942(+)